MRTLKPVVNLATYLQIIYLVQIKKARALVNCNFHRWFSKRQKSQQKTITVKQCSDLNNSTLKRLLSETAIRRSCERGESGFCVFWIIVTQQDCRSKTFWNQLHMPRFLLLQRVTLWLLSSKTSLFDPEYIHRAICPDFFENYTFPRMC